MVDDFVAGFRKLMDSPDAITGSKSQLVREPLSADDPKQRRRNVLGAHRSPQGRARRTIDQFDKLLAEG